MRWRIHGLLYLLALTVPGMAWGQQSAPSTTNPAAKAPAKKSPTTEPAAKPKSEDAAQEPVPDKVDPEAELQLAVTKAGDDNAALIKNLEDYLAKYPDTPRRIAIYRGILQADMQTHNSTQALDYAQKILAVQPEDTQTLYVAAMILERMPDDASQNRAIDYDTHLIANVSKADPESRPEQMTLDDWQAGRNKFLMNLYVSRGQIERRMQKTDDAVKDFTDGFRLRPSAQAALDLGEIAEEQKHPDEAIRQYAMAFFLAGTDPDDTSVTRDSLRLRMGNLWRFTHDSSNGLGDILLSAFDKNSAMAKVDQPAPAVYNRGVTDPLQFSMRKIDGSGTMKPADSHGKIVILNFWTTWCAYCRTTESLVATVRDKFSSRTDVDYISINADDEEAQVAPFLKEQKVDGTLAFADGIDLAMNVTTMPTVIVLDRTGKVAYRMQGYAPDDFLDAASAAITKAAAVPAP